MSEPRSVRRCVVWFGCNKQRIPRTAELAVGAATCWHEESEEQEYMLRPKLNRTRVARQQHTKMPRLRHPTISETPRC